MAEKKKVKDPLQGAIIFLHGFNKSGKTNLAYGFPQPMVFFATERGHKWAPKEIKDSMISLKPDDGWKLFKKTVTNLRTKKFRTVIIDVVDNLYRWACHDIMEKKHGKDGAKHPGDVDDFGASWDACRVGFSREIGRLSGICEEKDATFLMISHSAYRTIETLTSKIDKVMTALPGQAQSILLAEPDEIWHLAFGATATERILYLMGRDEIQCGSRAPTLVVESVSLPRDPRKAYLTVARAYLGNTNTKNKKEKNTS